MKNKSIAIEWLELAKRNLDAAKILFEAKHFNDVMVLWCYVGSKRNDITTQQHNDITG